MAPAGRQRTFELVPNAPILGQRHPCNDAQPIFSKPPMTTKQAKKLHNQKNKGPKLSKAEQRRIELLEQDRIRKEFDKEKAQARARTAREKKKAKEEKEKEDRKRKGLPLVDIHPSQDTISRFISRAGVGKRAKRDSTAANKLNTIQEEDNSETATEAEESGTDAGGGEEDGSDKENQDSPATDSGPERQAKKPRLSQAAEKMAHRISPVSSQGCAGLLSKTAREFEAGPYSRASSVDTDDPINQTLLENQLLADLVQASSRSVTDRGANEQRPTVVAVEQPTAPVLRHVAPTVSVSSALNESSEPYPLPPRRLSPQRSNTSVRKHLATLNARSVSRVPSYPGNGAFQKPTSPYVSATRPRPAVKLPVFQVPNAPPKFKHPAVHSHQSADRPRFLPKHVNITQQQRHSPAIEPPNPVTTHNLPTSTQAFLLDHADDLFPSPTQEARELSRNFQPEEPKPATNSSRLSISGALNCSEVFIHQNHVSGSSARPKSRPSGPTSPAPVAGGFFDSSCLSTQDFIISTQDILEIDTPSKSRAISTTKALLPPLNEELPAFTVHVEKTETSGANTSAVSNTGQGYILQSQSSAMAAKIDAKAPDFVACCPGGSASGSRRSQGHESPCRALSKLPSPLVTQREQDDELAAASRPLQPSYPRHDVVAQQRSTPHSKSTAAQASKHITTPKNPPPKKRLFGSSGPGPEGLVAMERSYQEMRREERAREAQVRAQERLVKARKQDEPDLDISEFVDDLLDDDLLGEGTAQGSSRRPSSGGAMQGDPHVQPLPAAEMAMRLVASQETDYGDVDGDDFDLLQGDTSWLDEDLDDV